MRDRKLRFVLPVALAAAACGKAAPQAQAQAPKQTAKPNILVIWGDDIGGFNISAYNQGVRLQDTQY